VTSRFLRPGFLVPVGDRLWVVDEFQPVAAVLDPGGGVVEQLVSWPELPPPPVTLTPWHDGWRVLGSPAGLWVQPFLGGPVALIGIQGLRRAFYSAGLRLGGVTDAGAWCGPQRRNRREHLRQPEDILLLSTEGDTRPSTEDQLVEQAPVHHPDGPASPWHHPPAQDTGAPRSGGLRWAVGWARDTGGPHHSERVVIATGHDPVDGGERRRIRFGAGRVRAFVAGADHLWVALRRPHQSGSVELSRVDTHVGGVETVLPAESIDITEHCWPRAPEPVDAEAYADYQRRGFEGLAPEGDLYGCRAELVGDWPDTTVELHCVHTRYPGLDLVRVLPLYDELGRQTPPEQAAHHLLETFGTGQLPSASAAVDGILHI
jgi:hypothetical protein